MLEDDSSRWN